LDKVKEFEEQFLQTLTHRHPEVLKAFREGKLTDEATNTLKSLASEIGKQYSK
jgi:F-type H+-transporting ATPase subunit alpha